MENGSDGNEYAPGEELEFILRKLGDFYEIACFGPKEEILVEYQKLEESTFDHVNYFGQMLEDEEAAFSDPETEESRGHAVLLAAIYASLAHCVEARRSKQSLNQRWGHISWAFMYLGMLRGTISGRQMGTRAAIRARAARAAAARHKETNAMKQQAFEWLSQNRGQYKSMDSTADALQKVVPVVWRTARDWVGLHKKMMEKKADTEG